MAEGKGRDEWSRTSSLMALIANGIPMVMVTKIGNKADPSRFNPYAEKQKTKGIRFCKENMEELKKHFSAFDRMKKHG